MAEARLAKDCSLCIMCHFGASLTSIICHLIAIAHAKQCTTRNRATTTQRRLSLVWWATSQYGPTTRPQIYHCPSNNTRTRRVTGKYDRESSSSSLRVPNYRYSWFHHEYCIKGQEIQIVSGLLDNRLLGGGHNTLHHATFPRPHLR